MLLIGLQLGNTGVMLAGIRDVVPRHRLGTVIGIFGASGPIGFAVGPALGGILIDGLGWSISGVFWVSSWLSIGTAALVWFGSREIRPEVVPVGRVLDLAYGAIRGVLADRTVRRIFAIYGVAFLANQMSRPYQPVLVEGIVGTGPGLASAIGFVAGTAALVGALAAPLGGVLGDRLGFRPVLVGALLGGAAALAATTLAPAIELLALAVLAFTAFNGAVGAMVFGLLATEVPADRRSATLNLVYLPLYAAGVVGPAPSGSERECSWLARSSSGCGSGRGRFRRRSPDRPRPDGPVWAGAVGSRQGASRCRRTTGPAGRASMRPGPSSGDRSLRPIRRGRSRRAA
jgi:MFS family permease